MKKMMLMGSIFAVIIIVFATFTSVVGANTEQSNLYERIEQIKEMVKENDSIIELLISLILLIPIIFMVAYLIGIKIAQWLYYWALY